MAVSVEDIILKYDPPVSELGMQLRQFLLKELKNVTEEADGPANIIGYGYGQGYKGMICTIIPSKKGMKLGFYKGTELPDPEKLLTGTGKVHKYVEIGLVADIKRPALKKLLGEAVKAYRARATR